MSAPNRGGSRRGGRGGRGGAKAPPTGAPAPVSVAAQLRQTARATEPEEMKVLRTFKEMGAVQIRSTYGLNGRLLIEVGFDADVLPLAGLHRQGDAPVQFFSQLAVENAHRVWEKQVLRDRALGRRSERLGAEFAETTWEALSPEQRRICLLSNKDFQSFRARQGVPTNTQAAGEEEEDEEV